ncbi:hypothetical protein B7P43_G04775 [Cryptotermes secundus]|uniref:Uncharacterized protein n=1 Tax=Cryptotermes secundus TaxID=105785 RepID=A0A2J7RFX6_9NEOP|nr:hypothetical protein B7P43_G04775 [Cryptotermes secundus]
MVIMSQRALRSRTVDTMSEEMDLGSREKSPEAIELTPALEIEGGRLGDVSEDSDERIGSKEILNSDMLETERSSPERSNGQGEKVSSSDLQTMMSMMQQLFQQLEQQRAEAKQAEERTRTEVKQSEERIVLECQRSKEQLNKELSKNLAAEIGKVTAEINQVKQEVTKWQGKLEREMIGVKQQFEKERKEQDAKLEQLVIHQETENVQIKQKVKEIQGIVENNKVETTREIMTVKVAIDMIQKELESSTSNVSRQLREQESRLEQKINVDQLKLQSGLKSLEQEMVQLKLKVSNQMRIPVDRTGVVTDGRTVNARGDVNKGSSNLESVKATGNLGSTEFALPLFDEDKGVNPVSHIRQLEEFFEFRGIQQQLWLIVAKRSIVGSVSKQWLEATSMTFASYEQFKSEFLSTWWSAAQQGLVKCRLYPS